MEIAGDLRKLPETYGNCRRLTEIAGDLRKLPETYGNCRRLTEIAGDLWKLPETYGNCWRLTVCVKKNAIICKICAPLLIRKRATLLWFASGFFAGSAGIRNCSAFLPNVPRFLPNALQFSERAHHIFTAKGAAIQGLRHFIIQRTAVWPSKCGAHGGRKAAHMAPCFQVLLWRVYCIIFDAYHSCQERKVAHFLTLTGVRGIASPIVSLYYKSRKLCHPSI